MPECALQRHDLVWLHEDAASLAMAAGPCSAAIPGVASMLADWVAARRPLIATRQAQTLAAGQFQLGLALPPQLGKHRPAFIVPAQAIARIERPPLLASAINLLPQSWQVEVARLLSVNAIRSCCPRVFGSAAITIHTGLNCLGPASDLDLLFEPRGRRAALDALEALRVHAVECSQPRIDGEIRNLAGEAVAWRELAGGASKILVKHDCDSPRLIERTAFAAGFERTEEVPA
jgi:phosphoribosyl-dephospho-CoA transferase